MLSLLIAPEHQVDELLHRLCVHAPLRNNLQFDELFTMRIGKIQPCHLLQYVCLGYVAWTSGNSMRSPVGEWWGNWYSSELVDNLIEVIETLLDNPSNELSERFVPFCYVQNFRGQVGKA